MAVEDFKEFLPADLRKRQQLIEYKKAMRQIHFPANHKELKEARKRLAFDELFLYTMALNYIRENGKEISTHRIQKTNEAAEFLENLPFSLTDAQKKVYEEICMDMEGGFVMNRLVQGDVGSGKSRGTSPINVNDMLEKVEMNQQIESEKQEIDKLLVEIREAKETLIKFNEDLEKAIAAECHIEGALKAAVGSCDNIVNGICNAIVKAERDTKFNTTITPDQLAKLKQLIDHSVESWISVLANHRAEQSKLITEHESNMRKILRRNEGVWFSDFWMRGLVIFLLVYTLGLGLVVYYVTYN